MLLRAAARKKNCDWGGQVESAKYQLIIRSS